MAFEIVLKLPQRNIYEDHKKSFQTFFVPKLPFQKLLHRCIGEGATPFPGLLHFTIETYLIMLSVKHGGIKYHFLSFSYDSIWDWTPVSRNTGEHSTTKPMGNLRKKWNLSYDGITKNS